ncbi:hypothetical protein NC652_031897 [Populus alba x Populus x berolinensis]|nr:hypothetical protein NC652_031897 [Populus alba x Populus x berolinensis]
MKNQKPPLLSLECHGERFDISGLIHRVEPGILLDSLTHGPHSRLDLKMGKMSFFFFFFPSKLTAKLLPFKFPDFNLSLLRIVNLHI